MRCLAYARRRVSPSVNYGSRSWTKADSSGGERVVSPPNSADSLNHFLIHEKVLILGVNAYWPSPLQAHSRDDRLEVFAWTCNATVSRPGITSACISSKATSRSTKSGRISHQEVRCDPAAGRYCHAGNLREAAAARLRTRLPKRTCRSCVRREVRQTPRVSVDLRGVRHVHDEQFDPKIAAELWPINKPRWIYACSSS